MGRSRYKIYDTDYPYYITSTIIEWMPLFSIKGIANIIIDSLNYLIKNNRLEIYGYVIMENHLHVIAVSDDLPYQLGKFKSFTARKIIDFLTEHHYNGILEKLEFFKIKHKTDRQHQFWQEGVHPEIISNLEILIQKLKYIHENPIRRGYVDEDYYWRYSSAVDYSGAKGLVEINKDWY